MKSTLLLTVVICWFLTGCKNRDYKDYVAFYDAVQFIQTVSPGAIQTCRNYNYTDLGKNHGIWKIYRKDILQYECERILSGDTQILELENMQLFLQHFPASVAIAKDDKLYRALRLSATGAYVRIGGIDYMSNQHYLATFPLKELFSVNDPFRHFETLENWRNDIGIDGVAAYPSYGNHLFFDMPGNYELLYLPSDFAIKFEAEKFDTMLASYIPLNENWYWAPTQYFTNE